jgi:hypothetical protein
MSDVRAMAQALAVGLSVRPGFGSRPVRFELEVKNVVLTEAVLREIRFCFVSIILPVLHTRVFICHLCYKTVDEEYVLTSLSRLPYTRFTAHAYE